MADLTTLYQGIFGSPWEPTPKSSGQNVGRGRWYTSDPATARSYAKGLTTGTGTPKLGGRVYSMDVPTKSLSQSTKFSDILGRMGYDHLGEFSKKPNVHLATKKMITEGAPKINWGQTLGANLDVLGSKGLGFLRNNALRTLAMLGSLPFQAGIMTLAPTRIGSAELPQMPQESPRQQTLQAQVTAQANREARERVGRGEARDYGHTQTRSSSGWRSDPMWKGGIVGLYRYGGFI